MSSDNGATFDLKHTVTGNGGGQRVEIETSNTNPNKVYILTEPGQADSSNPTIEVKLEVTNDAFATAPTELALPAGNETRVTILRLARLLCQSPRKKQVSQPSSLAFSVNQCIKFRQSSLCCMLLDFNPKCISVQIAARLKSVDIATIIA